MKCVKSMFLIEYTHPNETSCPGKFCDFILSTLGLFRLSLQLPLLLSYLSSHQLKEKEINKKKIYNSAIPSFVCQSRQEKKQFLTVLGSFAVAVGPASLAGVVLGGLGASPGVLGLLGKRLHPENFVNLPESDQAQGMLTKQQRSQEVTRSRGQCT